MTTPEMIDYATGCGASVRFARVYDDAGHWVQCCIKRREDLGEIRVLGATTDDACYGAFREALAGNYLPPRAAPTSRTVAGHTGGKVR